jgi:methionyl-tRNA synthetase
VPNDDSQTIYVWLDAVFGWRERWREGAREEGGSEGGGRERGRRERRDRWSK